MPLQQALTMGCFRGGKHMPRPKFNKLCSLQGRDWGCKPTKVLLMFFFMNDLYLSNILVKRSEGFAIQLRICEWIIRLWWCDTHPSLPAFYSDFFLHIYIYIYIYIYNTYISEIFLQHIYFGGIFLGMRFEIWSVPLFLRRTLILMV